MSEDMKPSGIAWIGDIPDNWSIKRVKYLASLKGRIGWQGLTSDEYTDEGPYLITGVDFKNGKVDWDSCVHITKQRWEEATEIQIQNDDLLITKDGTVGKVAIVSGLNNLASLNSGVLVIRTNENFDRKFLFWVLQSEEFWVWFRLKNAGNSTIIHLYQNDFADFCYTYPKKSEQTLIADFLDNQCEIIDSIASDIENQIKILQKYKKSLITETITKGLSKSVTMKDSGIKWIGSIPEHCQIKRLKFLTVIKDGTHDTPDYVDEGENTYPLITSKYIDYDRKTICFNDAKHISFDDFTSIYKRSNVEKGDIIMPMIGTIGNPVIVETEKKFAIKNVALFKTCGDNITAKFIFYQFYSDVLLEQFSYMSKGGVQSFVSLQILGNLCFVDTSCKLKKQLVNYLDEQCTNIDSIMESKKEQLNKMQQHKKSLIYEYVTGKKRMKGGV